MAYEVLESWSELSDAASHSVGSRMPHIFEHWKASLVIYEDAT